MNCTEPFEYGDQPCSDNNQAVPYLPRLGSFDRLRDEDADRALDLYERHLMQGFD